METSDVRSIDALRDLKSHVIELSADWDLAIQQIKSTVQRVEGHFNTEMKAYWTQQTRQAEQKLAEAQNNLSRQQGNANTGQTPAVTEARQRVESMKRRLKLCEEKSRLAAQIAIHYERISRELAGPLADMTGHAATNLPMAASHLERFIGHLDRYTDRAQGNTNPSVGPITTPESFLLETQASETRDVKSIHDKIENVQHIASQVPRDREPAG
jgi:hypothetical protein